MTDRERIAALELSNQRMKEALKSAQEELWSCYDDCGLGRIERRHEEYCNAIDAVFSSCEPSNIVEVLRQCEEALEYIAWPGYDRSHWDRVNKAKKALAALREIFGAENRKVI